MSMAVTPTFKAQINTNMDAQYCYLVCVVQMWSNKGFDEIIRMQEN